MGSPRRRCQSRCRWCCSTAAPHHPVSQHTAGRPAAVVQLQGDSQLRTHHVGLGRHLLQQLAQIQRVKLRRLPGTQKFQCRQQFVDGPFQLGRGRADVADCLQGLGVCPHAGQMLLQILAVAPDQPSEWKQASSTACCGMACAVSSCAVFCCACSIATASKTVCVIPCSSAG